MTSHIDQDNIVLLATGDSSGYVFDSCAGDNVGQLEALVLDSTIDHEDHKSGQNDFAKDVAGALQSACDLGDKISGQEAESSVGKDIQSGACQVEAKKLFGLHSHAAGERCRHRVHARDEFRKNQRQLAPLIERFCRTQDAGLRIHGNAT